MKRHRHLIAYDIRDSKRLREVARIMVGHGIRMQYSVFVCDLTAAERFRLLGELENVVDRRVDCVACIELGERDASRFTFIGPSPAFPRTGAQIV